MEKKRKKNQSEVIISNNKKIYSKQIEKKKTTNKLSSYQLIIKGKEWDFEYRSIYWRQYVWIRRKVWSCKILVELGYRWMHGSFLPPIVQFSALRLFVVRKQPSICFWQCECVRDLFGRETASWSRQVCNALLLRSRTSRYLWLSRETTSWRLLLMMMMRNTRK